MLKRYGIKKRDIWTSIIYGGVVGVMGVMAFVMLVKLDIGQQKLEVTAPVDEQKASIQVTGETFYALQHGVYSNDEQAQAFLASNPALSKAIALPIDNQYYVWSEVASDEATIVKPADGGFVKSFILNSDSCTKESMRSIPKWLKSENSLKFNFGTTVKTDGLPKDWETARTTAVSISDNMNVTRMHLIFHYVSSDNCLNIKFN